MRGDEAGVEVGGDAFAELYRLERGPMVGLATILLGSRRAAEDVVHDAFANLLPRFDAIENPGGYLRTSVVNGCHSASRRARAQKRFQTAWAVPTSDLPTEFIELAEALAQLPERQRVVLVLRYCIDWNDQEIASYVRCAPSTVRSIAARGLRSLKHALS